ncbi:MAG: CHRD domain-containing protein [Gemmatimonadota bacterium]
MNIRMLPVLAILGSAAMMAACDDDSDDQGPEPEVFTASLNATNEPPTGGVAVVSTAIGNASIIFLPSGLQYDVVLTSPLTTGVNNAHIHGPALPSANGVSNAGVVLNLNPNFGITTGIVAQGAFQGTGTSSATISMDSLKSMIRNGNAYVNVHTTRYGGGEIRGQLVPSN